MLPQVQLSSMFLKKQVSVLVLVVYVLSIHQPETVMKSHTGVIPFYKLFQASVKSCSQGGVRGGAATLYYPIWHCEVEDLLVLKNNKGTEDNRVRHMDYGVQFNKLMYERLIAGEDITLFSTDDVRSI